MSQPAPAHRKRQPLNLAAGDLRAALDMPNAIELRDLIDDYRSRCNAQHARMEEGSRLFYFNPRHPRALNPEAEQQRLRRLQSVLHHLLALHQLEPHA